MEKEKPPVQKLILSSKEAAERLGLSVFDLGVLIRRYRYNFTEIKPGGKPGDRGPNRWGLTEPQLESIVRGQARQWAVPETPKTDAPASLVGLPDGRSRLRTGGRSRLRPN